jgi:hypothetical protein
MEAALRRRMVELSLSRTCERRGRRATLSDLPGQARARGVIPFDQLDGRMIQVLRDFDAHLKLDPRATPVDAAAIHRTATFIGPRWRKEGM